MASPEMGSREPEEEIPQNIEEHPVNRRDFLGKMGKTAAGAIIGASLFAEGCKSKDIKSENDEREEIVGKDSEFLVAEMEKISGGALHNTTEGGVIINVGGEYYELKPSDLNQLMDVANNYRERIERAEASKGMKPFSLKLKQSFDMALKGRIIKMGKPVSKNKLPNDLKEYEKGRTQVKEEMEQMPTSKTLRSQKSTSSEAKEFFN